MQKFNYSGVVTLKGTVVVDNVFIKLRLTGNLIHFQYKFFF